MPRANSLSIFLITKNDFTKYKDLVIDGLSTKPIVLKEGELFYKTSDKDYYPSWVDGFFGVDVLGDYRKKLGTKTLSAVYFTSITIDEVKRTFAVTFGNGRYLIKKGCIQHGFGLNTSRHAIDALRITSMRTTTYDSNIKDKTIRSTSEIRQSEYFLNMDTDVLTAVSGKVREEGTGDLLQNRIIGGKDSVSMTAYVDVSNLSKFLKQLYAQYINDGLDGVNYKSNIRILEGEEEVAAAENLLQLAIDNYKTEDKVYLNLPLYDLEKNDKITGYKIDGVVYEDLTTNILDKYDTIKKTTYNGDRDNR